VYTQTQANAAFINDSLLTTTGDIIYASGANTPARRGIGSSGDVLTVSGGVPTWATPVTGGMTLLSTTSMSGTSTTVSGISGAYNQLVITVSDFYPSPTQGSFFFRLNSDSTANAYRYLEQQGDSGSPYATASPQWFFNANAFYFDATQNNADSNAFAWIELPNYADTTVNKFARFQSSWTNFGGNKQTIFGHGFWENTSAVTSIQFSHNGQTTAAGTIRIWGVK